MFQRKIYDKLLEWKKESAGKTALLIEGARRIGKSTIAEAYIFLRLQLIYKTDLRERDSVIIFDEVRRSIPSGYWKSNLLPFMINNRPEG